MSLRNSQKRAWYIVFLSALIGCSLSATFPQFSMTVLEISKKTGLGEAFLLSGDTIKSATIVLAMLCSGFFYKKIGGWKTVLIGLLCIIVPQFLLPYTPSAFVFILFKALQGFSSIMFPVFLLTIMEAIKEEQSGIATAVFNGIFYSGGGIGGTIAGILTSRFGWLSSYFVIGTVELILGIIWLISIKPSSQKLMVEEKKQRWQDCN
jgi:predicted MFS family arabinose efflux permease